MREQEKQMFCQILGVTPEHVETLERIAIQARFDSVPQLVRFTLANWMHSVMAFRDRQTSEFLNDVLATATEELAERN